MRTVITWLLVTLSQFAVVQFAIAKPLTVFAASSMTNAVNELSQTFEREYGIEVRAVYAGSSSLARQIQREAPADVFISANVRWVDYLVSQKVISASDIQHIAQNKLVLITSKSNSEETSFDISKQSDWQQYLTDERLAIGQVNAVPAGIYAKQALESLGLWPTVQSQLAPVNNVRQVLALVDRKEAPLGIVYSSDLMVSDGVTKLADFPDSSHDAIDYPLVTLNHDKQTKQFAEFVASEQGQTILRQHGFITDKEATL
ncbi:molybdate ABC transporter substrate-binding protein [Vibrio variabilis]|uniref:molybdate ABC transporter substrate-binding protein n=1 Tax=Vibrio variabilis TaxID=990271 RepID=UPI000DD61853|nr:molybdate ABC transporter substrate-binding protein [Vibrio variabilis]